MIHLNIHNETSELKSVLLGISTNFGGVPALDECYDPKSREHVLNNTFPLQNKISLEINNFKKILEKYNVDIYRPYDIKDLNQIFTRDICFVIEDKLIIPNIISERSMEIDAIDKLIDEVIQSDIIYMPDDSRVEGGDVVLYNDYIFIGSSLKDSFERYNVARTNIEAVDFISSCFPEKEIVTFDLHKSDLDPRKNALHLDCCFQPIGNGMAIIHKESFRKKQELHSLIDIFGIDNIIFVSEEEMYHMGCNVFSISNQVIVSEKKSVRINNALRDRGFIVEEINYFEIGKMEGSFRCSTMPLERL